MKWLEANFDDRQRKEIEFSILYLNEFEHGTDGHNAKVIIAKMASLLDKREVVLREALEAIARLTPFPTGQNETLDEAINKTADYADSVRTRIRELINDEMKNIVYRRFLPEQEYVESFERQGKTVPPFLVFQPYVERDGVKGYMVPCKKDDPDAEEWGQ